MSKNDGDRDETPIQFYIPRISQRHGRAPVPVNQPHWKYNTSAPGRTEWALIIFINLIFIFSFFVIAIQSNGNGGLVGLLVMGIACILISANIIRMYLRARTNQKLAPQGSRRAKPKKRHPKRRKDYN